MIFLIPQWSADVQLTRTQSLELTRVNFGARFQVSHFITIHFLGWISWRDYYIVNRKQTRKRFSSPRFVLTVHFNLMSRSKQVSHGWEVPLKLMKRFHSNKVYDWMQICWAPGSSARTNQFLSYMRYLWSVIHQQKHGWKGDNSERYVRTIFWW